MMFWFKKKLPVKRQPTKQRVAVHCFDSTSVAHYAAYRTIRANGGLTLHDEEGGGQVVADYAPGVWMSVSIGTRKVKS
jgi:hypothetical protein